jgi:hypothetical protein
LTQTIETLRTIRLHIDQRCIVKDVCYILDSNHETTLELDSHANTCVLGCDALTILDYNRPVSVVGYDLRSKTYQTVSGVVAYDDPQTRRTLHLIINQAIHIPHLNHHLLCPMQCRVNDVSVNNLPKFLAADPTDQTHALTLTDPNNPLQLVILPLTLRGVTLLLNVRSVTIDEFNSHDYLRIHLTSDLVGSVGDMSAACCADTSMSANFPDIPFFSQHPFLPFWPFPRILMSGNANISTVTQKY